MHSAALTGNEMLLRKLILKDKNAVHSVDGADKETPLHVASFKQHLNICKILSENNANPSTKDIHGNNSLHKVVMAPETEFLENRRDLIQLLLDNNVSINSTNNEGKTSVHIASERGYTNTMLILSNVEGCELNVLDKFVFFYFHYHSILKISLGKEIVQFI